MPQVFQNTSSGLSGRSYPYRLIWPCVAVLLLSCGMAKRRLDCGISHLPWNGASADAYVVNTKTSRIGVYGSDQSSKKFGSFASLQDYCDHTGRKLAFATNGGMFHADYKPVGLLVEDGIERSPLNLGSGDGNFFLKPNGVFLVSDDGTAAIVRSEKFPRSRHGVRAATQSGPLLVIDGKINPAFKEGSANRFVRSGVGVIDSHTVIFAISNEPVNFWDFAHLFRDVLRCKNALYLDGAISKFYLPGTKFAEGEAFGVLIGVTENSWQAKQAQH
jgi:uncharacterized protein YigE (DUF2233 family)